MLGSIRPHLSLVRTVQAYRSRNVASTGLVAAAVRYMPTSADAAVIHYHRWLEQFSSGPCSDQMVRICLL